MSSLKIWAGVECTLNRVGDVYYNQCEKSGHNLRPQDLELFASLGVERLRYPCLWEVTAPDGEYHWDWLDERLTRMRELDLPPIATLLHHGSGPRSTSLVDPRFPEKFTLYARRFAERFPWVEDYTPINEPLTTARFSCLYGFWYPHGRDHGAFVRAVFHQTRATILAMKAIREVNPRARLIQTEDLGRAQSTPPLEYQRDFENARRWLSLDLLIGKIDPGMSNYLRENGLTAREIDWLRDNATPPDIIGLNHYLLSNRFLDHRLELYPPQFHGGNGRDVYADVGAIDSPHAPDIEPASIFLEAWQRYGLPLAITEVHVRGHRESQMRWLKQIWSAAQEVRARGADLRAITAWSLLGTYDWNSLCMRNEMFYEPGVFDLRSGEPRPTALTHLVRELARAGDSSHPALDNTKPVLVAAPNEKAVAEVTRILDQRKLNYRLVHAEESDLQCVQTVHEMLARHDAWAMVDAGSGAASVVEACAERRLPVVILTGGWTPDQMHSELDRLLDENEGDRR